MSETGERATSGDPAAPRSWWRAFRALPDPLRVTTYVVGGLVLALVVAGLFALALVRRPLPETSGEVEVPGLGAEVTVTPRGCRRSGRTRPPTWPRPRAT